MTKNELFQIGVALFAVNGIFVFRFQRTTLGVARKIVGATETQVVGAMQALMTPVWIGTLGWAHTICLLLLPLLIWWHYTWYYGAAVVLGATVGIALFDFLSPLPPYSYCFRLMLAELDQRIRGGDIRAAQLKQSVIRIQQEGTAQF
jgi:hypothetical protein